MGDKVKQSDTKVGYDNAVNAPDQEDDDDGDDDEDEKDAKFYDCVGNVPAKLKANKCLFIKQKVMEAADDEKQSSDVTRRLFDAQFRKFKNGQLKQKYSGKELQEYPRNHRFCSVFDRRAADKSKGIIDGDELIFFEPPDDCNTFPEKKHLPMFYFETSRKCIIPGEDVTNIENQRIKMEKMVKNSQCANKGGTIVFSFHVESTDEIRCYMYVNGQACRFLADDVRLVLPTLFDMEYADNKTWIGGKECGELMERMKKQLRDVHFMAFLNKYRTKLNPN